MPKILNISNVHLSPSKTIPLAIVLGLILFTYFNFTFYRPKVLKQISEVKGYKTQDTLLNVPYMTGTKEIGLSSTKGGRQITLEVNKTPETVRSFYKNVFLDKGWVMTTSSKNDNSTVDSYKLDDYSAAVIISKEDAISRTVIGINITQND
jgi:hypothetical protein